MFVLPLILSTLLGVEPLGPGDHTRTLEHDGRTRTYIVHVPPKYDPKQPTPVVLAFHGGGSNAEQMHFHGTDDEFLPFKGGTGTRSLTQTEFYSVVRRAWAKDKNAGKPRQLATESGSRSIGRLGRPAVGFSRHPVCHQPQLVGAAARSISRSRLQPGFSI